jgi:DNA sulfur modification protein DndD
MIINSISIKNFQTYYGTVEFEFDEPTKEKNIVLIGGLNGAGKTSFFSSIVLGLFGNNAEGIVFDRASGESISDSYENYLNTVFSNTARQKNETEMEIAISLTHEKKR